jgi:hypothetical protein
MRAADPQTAAVGGLSAKLASLSSKDLRGVIETAISATPELAPALHAAVDRALDDQRRRRQARKGLVSSDGGSNPSLTPLYALIFDDEVRRPTACGCRLSVARRTLLLARPRFGSSSADQIIVPSLALSLSFSLSLSLFLSLAIACACVSIRRLMMPEPM